jgi:hypothetical protein
LVEIAQKKHRNPDDFPANSDSSLVNHARFLKIILLFCGALLTTFEVSADSWGKCSQQAETSVFTLQKVLRRSCLSEREQVLCGNLERAHPELKSYLNTCNSKSNTELTIECAPTVGVAMGLTAIAVVVGVKGFAILGGAYGAYKLATDFSGEEKRCFYDLDGKRERIQKFNSAMPDPRFVVALNDTFIKNVTCIELHRTMEAKWRSFLVESKSKPEVYLTKDFDNGVITDGWINPALPRAAVAKYSYLMNIKSASIPRLLQV